eukprot:scaffold12213_cov30-Tisochrysis_lutea.AAC.2
MLLPTSPGCPRIPQGPPPPAPSTASPLRTTPSHPTKGNGVGETSLPSLARGGIYFGRSRRALTGGGRKSERGECVGRNTLSETRSFCDVRSPAIGRTRADSLALGRCNARDLPECRMPRMPPAIARRSRILVEGEGKGVERRIVRVKGGDRE